MLPFNQQANSITYILISFYKRFSSFRVSLNV